MVNTSITGTSVIRPSACRALAGLPRLGGSSCQLSKEKEGHWHHCG